MRQYTIFKKKDGCRIASTKLVASPWAGLTKQLYKQFPKGLLYVQVIYKYIVIFTS
jgi:hypothetical protein